MNSGSLGDVMSEIFGGCQIPLRCVATIAGMLVPLAAQIPLGGTGRGSAVYLFSNDRAVLEAGEARKDLPCTVTHQKPILGFDLRFHSTYDVMIPMRELAGSENLLTVLFRVTPEASPDQPLYFSQKIRVPSIEEDAKGEAFLQGAFDVGEGKYRVDWLLRDRSERVCSDYWDIEAALPPKDKQIGIVAPANTVLPSEPEQFRDEPPIERNPESPLNVKVLVNFAPQNARSATLQPLDVSALVSILRTISRDPRIGRFSIVAFNMHERRVLHKQANAERIDFPAIGKALTELKLGTIDINRLSDKNGETTFLANLLREELCDGGAAEPADAYIFAGPKAMLEENVSPELLKSLGDAPAPVFYMNYNLWPQQIPWKDSISHAIKHFRGIEYTITRPRDLWYAVSEMVARVAKTRESRRAQLQVAQ
jgi:hypothetical protein